MAGVFLSLGTNMGNKRSNISTALDLLEKNGIKPVKLSGLYETEPVGMKNQPDFNNLCVKAETLLEPTALLEAVKRIELDMGRIKGGHWGPRIIDIDILFYSNIIINSPGLIIPHPEIARRKFVLEPLNELAGDFLHPVDGKTVNELLNTGNFTESTRRLGELR